MLDLIFACVVIAACFVVLDRKDKRAVQAQSAARAENSEAVMRLVDRMRDLEAEHRSEVQMLLQRIQAPEVAVVQHQQQNAVDENPYPLTDEESAEAQNEVQRMIADLERLENAGLV